MKYILWLVGGFGLLKLASAISGIGDLGATSAERLPFYFVALVAIAGSLFCFYKTFRYGMDDMRFGGSAKQDTPKVESKKAIPAKKKVEAEADTGFDVDGAFERYMSTRKAEPAAESSENSPPPVRTFGRKTS